MSEGTRRRNGEMNEIKKEKKIETAITHEMGCARKGKMNII